MDIRTLDQVAAFLEERGYKVERHEDTVVTDVGGFRTVVTLNDTQLTISAQLGTLGQVLEDRVVAFFTAALDANTRIAPFAFATITAADNASLEDPITFPIVLIDTLPVGDISEEELQFAFDSLLQALLGTREVLEVGFGSFEGEDEGEDEEDILDDVIDAALLGAAAVTIMDDEYDGGSYDDDDDSYDDGGSDWD